MKFKDYAIGGIGMIPMSFGFVFIGTTIGSIHDAVNGDYDHGPVFLIFLIFGLVFGFLLCSYMTVVIRRHLKQNLSTNFDQEDNKVDQVTTRTRTYSDDIE